LCSSVIVTLPAFAAERPAARRPQHNGRSRRSMSPVHGPDAQQQTRRPPLSADCTVPAALRALQQAIHVSCPRARRSAGNAVTAVDRLDQ